MERENPYLNLTGAPAPAATPQPQAAASGRENPYLAVPPPSSETTEDEDRPGVFEDIGRGIVTAPVSLAQGLAEAGAIGIDTIFGTNATRNVTDFFEGAKENIAPQRGVGQAAEEMLLFGAGFIPIAGWLGRASAVARGKNLGTATSAFMRTADRFGRGAGKSLLSTRAGLVGATALGTGVYETLVSPSGRSTMADSFQFLPDSLKTEADERLTGRDEAFRQLRNKLRQGAEASAMSLGFDAALFGASTGARALGTVPGVSELNSSVARTVSDAFDALGRGVARVPGGQKATQEFKRFFSPSKGANIGVFEEAMDTQTRVDASRRKAARLLQEFENSATKAIKGMFRRRDRSVARTQLKDDLYRFLLGDRTALDAYGEDVVKSADQLLKARTQLSDLVYKSVEDVAANAPPGQRKQIAASTLAEMQRNEQAQMGYLNRLFERHERPVEFYKNLDVDDPLFESSIDEAASYIARGQGEGAATNPAVREEARRVVLSMMGLESVLTGAEPRQAIKKIIETLEDASKNGGRILSKESPVLKLDTGMFIERKELIENSPSLRALMGEIKDPDELYVTTMDKLARTGAGSAFYRTMRRGGLVKPLSEAIPEINNGGRPVFVEVPDEAVMRPGVFAAATEGFEPNAPLRRIQEAQGVAPFRTPGMARELEDWKTALEQNGYVQLGEWDSGALFGGTFGELTGMYVPKEMYRALTAPLELNGTGFGEALAVANQVRGLSQKMLIIPNPASRVRDVLGNALMLVGNSNIPRDLDLGTMVNMFMKGLSDLDDAGLARVKAKLELSGTQDTNLLLSAVREYLREGENLSFAGKVAKRSEQIAKSRLASPITAINDMFARFTEGTDSFFKGLAVMSEEAKYTEAFRSAGLEDLADDIIGVDFLGQGLAKRSKAAVAEELDTAARIETGELADILDRFSDQGVTPTIRDQIVEAARATEIERSERIFSRTNVRGPRPTDQSNVRISQRSLTEALENLAPDLRDVVLSADEFGVRLSPLEVMAADVVKDTMPIYSRVGAAVRALDRFPFFGNFTSFASENIRNSVNILHRGMKEMGFQLTPQRIAELGITPQQARKLERQIRALGAQRLVGYLSVAAAAPKTMVRASMQATGTTDEQMDRIYEQTPEYLDGHDLVITENDGKGRFKYIDLSYVAPYGYITDSIQAALRTYSERGVLGKNEADQIASGVFNGLATLADPFGSESIIFERVRDVLPSSGLGSAGFGRGGQTSTGALVYNETDDLGSKVSQGFLHVVDSLVPAYAKLLGESRGGEIKPGRLTRAMTEVPGARGQEYNEFEELARQVTGFTPMELNLQRDFEFSGKAYAPRRSDAKTAANRILRRADATEEDMVQGWQNYLDALYREQSRLYNDIQGARELGLSDQDIRRELVKDANLGSKEVNSIMRGQFYPSGVSDELLSDVRRQLRQDGNNRLVRRIPVQELNRLTRERMRQDLAPELYRRNREEAQATPVPVAPAAPAAPTLAMPRENPYTRLASAPAASPAPVAPSAPSAAPPAELLGGSLMDRIRNSEVAQRLRGEG